jgi:hypothetical protein
MHSPYPPFVLAANDEGFRYGLASCLGAHARSVAVPHEPKSAGPWVDPGHSLLLIRSTTQYGMNMLHARCRN